MMFNYSNSMSKPMIEAQTIKQAGSAGSAVSIKQAGSAKGGIDFIGLDERQPTKASIYTVKAKGLDAATPKPCGCQGEQTAMAIVTAHPLLIGGLAAAAFGLGLLVGRR